MASPNSSWSEITVSTIESRSPEIADNFSVSTALMLRLKQKGKIKFWTGGDTIAELLAFAENSTYTRMSGYDTVDISPSEVFTAAHYAPKFATVAVTISKEEQLKNSGKERMFDLLEAKIENAEKTLMQNVAIDQYSDGTASGGKQIGGLAHLIPTDPTTGIVGNINRATWSFWQPWLTDHSTGIGSGSVTPGLNTIQSIMNYTYLNVTRGKDRPDLIVFDNTYYGYYWASLQGNQRFVNTKLADAGFENIRFMGADVVYDGGVGGGMSSATGYFLNTDYIHWRPHVDANFVPADPETRVATNQLALVKLLLVAGNMTLSNSRLQARIQN